MSSEANKKPQPGNPPSAPESSTKASSDATGAGQTTPNTSTQEVPVGGMPSAEAAEPVAEQPAYAPKTERALETERLSRLPEAAFDSRRPTGVLLSDEIDYYATHHALLFPYSPENLKPAGYELRVGQYYALNGTIEELRENQTLTIPPFAVAVIQTLETVNLPAHLIARWNVRTRWAYRGLLWVGSAQVDAGFRGYLACPLYNLSNEAVSIGYGEHIAVVDFVTTTPPNSNSKRYDWKNRTRVTFKEYEPNRLRSAIETDIIGKLKSFEAAIKGFDTKEGQLRTQVSAVQSRVDSQTSAVFTIIAMLFAALGLAVARSTESSFWTSTVWLAAISLWFAMRAYVLIKSRLQHLAQHSGVGWGETRVPWKFEVWAAVIVAVFLVVAQFKQSQTVGTQFSELQSRVTTSAQDLHNLQARITELNSLNSDLAKQVQELRSALQMIRSNSRLK